MESIFFDHYNTPLLRVDTYHDVCNHSQLVVAPGTVAYLIDGDVFSDPLFPGVHTLRTEIGWFRKGVHGSSVTVCRIGTRENYFCKSGSGLFYFESPGIAITRSARAPYTLVVRIADGALFIRQVLGYRPQDGQETLDQLLTFYAAEQIQNVLKDALNRQAPAEVDLGSVGAAAARNLRPVFGKYGIELVALTICELNIVNHKAYTELESELARLKAICGNDKQFYLYYLMVTQGKATPSDLMAWGNMMTPTDTPPPDTWGGI